MKGLIYREFYLSRKNIFYMLLAYVIFVAMITMVIISTYSGNLAKDKESAEMRSYLLSQMYLYAALIGMLGCTYGHNDLIEKDYKSKWQLYSYTLPVSENKVILSKMIVRVSLLLAGLALAVLAEVIFSAAGKASVSMGHFKNILLMLFLYGALCIADIPYLLRMKTQSKGVAFALIWSAPLVAGIIYGIIKFVKFCTSEARRLYPDMEGDAGIMKVAMPYINKYRDMTMWIAPFIFATVLVITYLWGIKELKRRRY